ncbi:helix-turn-helix domain-containing protein [Actinomadura syzygii]|uniref:helix-turn-helix domain-containing protein n=1 Tax=Actinomadura syzygii TaxID=1427538 RepID=UPI001FEB9A18|nr:helix-turn-helix transcriptional regulator [Actinomadura syzygii]
MSNSNDTEETVGVRLARERKRRGLTQTGLAQRISYSRSFLAGVEAGHRMPSPSFVSAVARALGVDPAALYGQPYDVHDDYSLHAAIPALRRALVAAEIGPDLDAPPRPLDTLAAEVATVRRLLNEAQMTKAGNSLPPALDELAAHAHQTDDPRAWALLSRGLYLGASFARRLGCTGDALALLQAETATAARADDPNLPLLIPLLKALVLMGMDDTRQGLKLLNRAIGRVDLSRPDGPEVAGALELRAAILAARLGEEGAAAAWDHHGRAVERIRSAGTVAEIHGQQTNTANAAIHGAAVAVELGDVDEAIRRDAEIGDRTLDALSEERVAHHAIDMSRALTEAGAYDRALDRLTSADHIAPQFTRAHPSAHVVVAHLVDVRRALPEPLRRLDRRIRT